MFSVSSSSFMSSVVAVSRSDLLASLQSVELQHSSKSKYFTRIFNIFYIPICSHPFLKSVESFKRFLKPVKFYIQRKFKGGSKSVLRMYEYSLPIYGIHDLTCSRKYLASAPCARCCLRDFYIADLFYSGSIKL